MFVEQIKPPSVGHYCCSYIACGWYSKKCIVCGEISFYDEEDCLNPQNKNVLLYKSFEETVKPKGSLLWQRIKEKIKCFLSR